MKSEDLDNLFNKVEVNKSETEPEDAEFVETEPETDSEPEVPPQQSFHPALLSRLDKIVEILTSIEAELIQIREVNEPATSPSSRTRPVVVEPEAPVKKKKKKKRPVEEDVLAPTRKKKKLKKGKRRDPW